MARTNNNPYNNNGSASANRQKWQKQFQHRIFGLVGLYAFACILSTELRLSSAPLFLTSSKTGRSGTFCHDYKHHRDCWHGSSNNPVLKNMIHASVETTKGEGGSNLRASSSKKKKKKRKHAKMTNITLGITDDTVYRIKKRNPAAHQEEEGEGQTNGNALSKVNAILNANEGNTNTSFLNTNSNGNNNDHDFHSNAALFHSITEEDGKEPQGNNGANVENRNQHKFLNDKTLHWDENVQRLWLDTEHYVSKEKPPAMLLLTTMAFNHWDQTNLGLKSYRSIRQRELLNGVINHPYFLATGWQDIHEGNAPIHPDVNYYIFLDKFTCNDAHWPIYNGGERNLDSAHGRNTRPVNSKCSRLSHCFDIPQLAQESRLLTETTQSPLNPKGKNNARFVYLDCNNGIENQLPEIRNKETFHWPVTVAAMHSTQHVIHPYNDMGLPPPLHALTQIVPQPTNGGMTSTTTTTTDGNGGGDTTPHDVQTEHHDGATASATKTSSSPASTPSLMTDEQVQDIYTCRAERQRHLLLSFYGFTTLSPVRAALALLHNETAGIFVADSRDAPGDGTTTTTTNLTQAHVYTQSIFGAAPRGKAKYSYQFTQVLAAGAIPVVWADDWVWPFWPELVPWEQCAVILPETSAHNHTLATDLLPLLRGMSENERCQRRQKCHDIFKNYMATPQGTINGIIASLEKVANLPRDEGENITNGQPEQQGQANSTAPLAETQSLSSGVNVTISANNTTTTTGGLNTTAIDNTTLIGTVNETTTTMVNAGNVTAAASNETLRTSNDSTISINLTAWTNDNSTTTMATGNTTAAASSSSRPDLVVEQVTIPDGTTANVTRRNYALAATTTNFCANKRRLPLSGYNCNANHTLCNPN